MIEMAIMSALHDMFSYIEALEHVVVEDMVRGGTSEEDAWDVVKMGRYIISPTLAEAMERAEDE